MILQRPKKIASIAFCVVLIVFTSACSTVNQPESQAETNGCKITPQFIEDIEDETERFYLTFARDYSICCGTMNFQSADDLSDANKFLLFKFFQYYINREKGTPSKLEAKYYSHKDHAVVLPVSTVVHWLKIYLGTDSFDPAKAALDDLSLTYDSATETIIVPSLSGFGGVRCCGLLDAETTDGILTMDVGFYYDEEVEQTPPEFHCYEQVELKVKLRDDPYQFQLLSWVTTKYDEDGTVRILDSQCAP